MANFSVPWHMLMARCSVNDEMMQEHTQEESVPKLQQGLLLGYEIQADF